MIPTRLADNTTVYKHHNFYTHLVCVLLRVILGASVTYKLLDKKFIVILSILIIFAFSYKAYINPHSWKNYPRTLISYLLTILFTIFDNIPINIGGLLIIEDALLGQQSRWISNNFAN